MLRREQAERSREALLDAAAAEFWLHGFGGTRIQDVLDRAGLTKGGLYHHFTSKQEIADALLAQEAGRWPEVIAGLAAADTRGLSAAEAFSLVIAKILEQDVRARAVLRLAEELEAGSPFEVWHDYVLLALQQAIADGEVADSIPIRQAATMIVESVYGVCTSPAPMSRGSRAADRVAVLWQALDPGLRATRTR